jgi:hypothetical protein
MQQWFRVVVFVLASFLTTDLSSCSLTSQHRIAPNSPLLALLPFENSSNDVEAPLTQKARETRVVTYG